MSSLNMLWRMLAVDLRFGAREVAGRFGAEALQLHRVERPRAQRHRHRGGVRGMGACLRPFGRAAGSAWEVRWDSKDKYRPRV